MKPQTKLANLIINPMTMYKKHAALAAALAILPLMATAAQYPINYPLDAKIDITNRSLQSVVLASPTDGEQTIAINQEQDKLLYHDATNRCFTAVPGETVTASFNWTGGWMHGYVYLDRGNDGSFDFTLDDSKQFVDRGDVMAYTNFNGTNSAGSPASGNCGFNPPQFTIPADLQPGLYRMRYKIDWNSIDPGGNTAEGLVHQQLITANAGAIADVMVYLHNGTRGLEVNAPNCSVTGLNGEVAEETAITPGRPFSLIVHPDEGYRVSAIKVSCGNKLDVQDIEFANTDMAYKEASLPLSQIDDNILTIPGAYTYGRVVLEIAVEEGRDPSLDYYSSSLSGTKDCAGITRLSMPSPNRTDILDIATDQRHIFNDTKALTAEIGTATTISADFDGPTGDLSLYIDLGQTGQFPAEAAAAFAGGEASFTLPATVKPGVYRARVEAKGTCAVDFLLNAHNASADIRADILNGYLAGAAGAILPATAAFGQPLTIEPKATLPGFRGDKLTVRHGHNVAGRQYIRGNRQWDEFEIPAEGSTELTADEVDGTLFVIGELAETPDSEWTLVWHDEFSTDEMDADKWSYHPRNSAVWNRFCAVGDERPVVNKFEDGLYRSYCVKTPAEFATEQKEMISGAIYTSGKFYLTGGYIEARCKTLPHKGNFQAFWMMPSNQSYGWPSCGEIDIWEQIDTENIAYGSLHDAWRYRNDAAVVNKFGTISKPCPYSGGTKSGVNAAEWHVYAIDWDSEQITWLIDGVPFATARNPHYSEGKWTEDVTWPFDKAFYIICNQSVGTGSWAKAPDLDFTYRTDFDYVRAYQKKDRLNYFSIADGLVAGVDNVISDNDALDPDAPVEFYTLQGIRVNPENLAPGIYIRRQGKNATKIAIR